MDAKIPDVKVISNPIIKIVKRCLNLTLVIILETIIKIALINPCFQIVEGYMDRKDWL